MSWLDPSYSLQKPSRGLIRTSQFMIDNWAAAPVNGTVSNLLSVEDDFDLIRLVFGNDTAAVSVVNNVILAPTANPNDGVNPLNGSGAAVAWTQVTFNANGADVLPSATPAGGTVSLTIPAATNANSPVRMFSDWMRVSSLPRSDGGALRLLMVRQFTAVSGTSRMPFAQSVLQPWLIPAVNRGRVVQSYVQFNVDGVSTPANFNSAVPYWFVAPLAVQYYSRTRGATLSVFGDSITAGARSLADRSGWPFLAATSLSSPAHPVQLFNQGWTGQTGANIYANAVATVALSKPDVACFATWTPNDQPATQATADLSWSRAVELAEMARVAGAVPILITPIPYIGLTAAQEAFRLSVVNRALSTAASGSMLVADMNSALTNGAFPARILPQFDSGDGTHPNDAGYAAMAAVVTPVIRQALAL